MKIADAVRIGLIVYASTCLMQAQQDISTEPNEEPPSRKPNDPPLDAVHLTLNVEHRRMFGPGYKSFTEGRLGAEMIENEHHGLSVFIFGGLIELEEGTSAHDDAHDPAVVGF